MIRLCFSKEPNLVSPPCDLVGGWSCAHVPVLESFETNVDGWETEEELMHSYPFLAVPLCLYFLYQDDPQMILELASRYVIPHLQNQRKEDENPEWIPEKKTSLSVHGCDIVYRQASESHHNGPTQGTLPLGSSFKKERRNSQESPYEDNHPVLCHLEWPPEYGSDPSTVAVLCCLLASALSLPTFREEIKNRFEETFEFTTTTP